MNQNIFFALFNSIIATMTIVVFYSVFKAKNVDDLYEAFKTRPVLAMAVRAKVHEATFAAASTS